VFANVTLFESRPCSQGSPSGCTTDRSGLGSLPNLRRMSLALELVPQGGPRCTAATLSCCKMRHKSASPCSEVKSNRMTGDFTRFVTWASTPMLCANPMCRMAAVRPPVPEKTSIKRRSAIDLPKTRFENCTSNSEKFSWCRLMHRSGAWGLGPGSGKFFWIEGTVESPDSHAGVVVVHWCNGWAPPHLMHTCIPLLHSLLGSA